MIDKRRYLKNYAKYLKEIRLISLLKSPYYKVISTPSKNSSITTVGLSTNKGDGKKQTMIYVEDKKTPLANLCRKKSAYNDLLLC